MNANFSMIFRVAVLTPQTVPSGILVCGASGMIAIYSIELRFFGNAIERQKQSQSIAIQLLAG
jgi:hypothetical protein